MKSVVISLNRIFDVLWIPFSKTPAYIDLVLLSAVSAVIFLLIFKKTSNQTMIKRYRNKMVAHILEIRLYKDEPMLTVKSILEIFWSNLIYLRYTLVPLTVIFVPLFIISIQVNNRYGYSPVKVNESFIIQTELSKTLLRDNNHILEKVQCKASGGIFLETPPLRIQAEAKIFWRARVINLKGNQHLIRLAIDGKDSAVEKKIFTSRAKQRFSPERRKWGIKSVFASSAEDFIPKASPFEVLRLNYDRATYPFLVWNIDPLVLYFIFTLIFGLVFKPLLGVHI